MIMIIGAIIVGVLIFALIGLVSGTYINKRCGGNFDVGMFIGGFMTNFNGSWNLFSFYDNRKTNTISYWCLSWQITSVNGTPIDTVVVFKKNNNYEKFLN